MRLVLDANQYIYVFGEVRKPSCEALVRLLLTESGHEVRIVRILLDEVLRNIPPETHKHLYGVLDQLLEEECSIDEDFVIPYPRGEHFREVGFKEADALIAAYAEAVGADVLVSENRRHFHAMADRLPFRVMDAECFLRQHPAGR